MTLHAVLTASPAVPCRPWPRHSLAAEHWAVLRAALGQDTHTLCAAWADTVEIHALLLEEEAQRPILASTRVAQGTWSALSAACPSAAPFERMIHDLWGHRAEGGAALEPWLDHDQWPVTHPLSPRPGPPPTALRALAEDGAGMVLISGPVDAMAGVPAQLHLSLDGPRIRGATVRLGHAHKGSFALMRSRPVRIAARFAARLSGEATVAHAIAFARAAEAALGITAPPRAEALRALLLEWERMSVHLDRLGMLGRLAGGHGLAGTADWLRERLAQAAEAAFGHRLLMDIVVPGGLTHDIAPDGEVALRGALTLLADHTAALARGLAQPSVASRLGGLGAATPAILLRLGCAGVTGRAGGRSFDARRFDPWVNEAGWVPQTRTAGDALARAGLRLDEIGASRLLTDRLASRLPDGPVSAPLPAGSGEGLACAEAADGDVWHWVRLDHGSVAAGFARDPGWGGWAVAAAVLRDTAVEDAALLLASLGLGVSGVDL